MLNCQHSRRFAQMLVLAMVLSGCGGGDDDDPAPSSETVTPGAFNVRLDGPERFVRVDRMGQPAVATALLSRAPGSRPNGDNQRDAFNRADPEDDASFVTDMLETLKTLQQQLNPALISAGLTPCAEGYKCVVQVAPVIVPDVVTLDLDRPTNWPNGRAFDDPVVDRLLALALLDLTVHDIDVLSNLPLNPPGNEGNPNDRSPAEFPYLRPAFSEPDPPPPAPG